MRTQIIDSSLFAGMLVNGIHSLQAIEKELNAMNVFPVADGDTGTNMLATLKNGIKSAADTTDLCEYLKSVSSGMLLGARGNSGVILSQIFKGIYLALMNRTSASIADMRGAFIRGYQVAYEAVAHPEEGTILTVCREGIENTAEQMDHISDMGDFFHTYLASMEVSLDRTPELLPVLAEMGVVDSGGKGYIALIQGMADYLDGIIHTEPQHADGGSEQFPSSYGALDYSAFDADSRFDEGYCLEFILQLLRSEPYDQSFDSRQFTSALEQMGESLVIVCDDTRVKVHVHTKRPAQIITHAQQYGEFLTFKLENMQLQHNEYLQKQKTAAPSRIPQNTKGTAVMATIAAVNGHGLKEILQNLGCSQIIECGPTMSVSTEEFVNAINAANAEHIVILPGNPNLILAAQQAAQLSGRDAVVLEAKTIPEVYFALAMDIQDSDDYIRRIEQMQLGIENVDTFLVATAAKTFSHNGITFAENKWVSIHHSEPVLTTEDPVDAIEKSLQMVEDLDDKSICVLIRGNGASSRQESDIQARLQASFPMLECCFLEGGQQVHSWIIGLT